MTASTWQTYDSVLPLCIVPGGLSALGFSIDSVLSGCPFQHYCRGDGLLPQSPSVLSKAMECRIHYAQTLGGPAVMDAIKRVVLAEVKAVDCEGWA